MKLVAVISAVALLAAATATAHQFPETTNQPDALANNSNGEAEIGEEVVRFSSDITTIVSSPNEATTQGSPDEVVSTPVADQDRTEQVPIEISVFFLGGGHFAD